MGHKDNIVLCTIGLPEGVIAVCHTESRPHTGVTRFSPDPGPRCLARGFQEGLGGQFFLEGSGTLFKSLFRSEHFECTQVGYNVLLPFTTNDKKVGLPTDAQLS